MFKRSFIISMLAATAMLAASCNDDSPSKTPDTQCDESKKPEGTCVCTDGAWVCETTSSCTEDEPEDMDCVCTDGKWECKPYECEADCLLCSDGVCHATKTCTKDCEFGCNSEGECLSCPIECLNDCDENGVCNTSSCDDECKNGCDENGECICPENCEYGCDEDGSCAAEFECSEDCENGCNEDGSCTCPETCKNGCDEDGACIIVCSDTCKHGCDEDGECVVCPSECPDSCNEDGECPIICPDECPDSCDLDAKCPIKCPDACSDSCDENGVCPCPSECGTSCDANGVCQCPSTCAGKCDSTGLCPATMCGGEVVKKIYFGQAEVDLIHNDAYRNKVNSMFRLVTDKSTYNLNDAPCTINLTSSDKSVVAVAKASNGNAQFTAKKDAGSATVTATVAGTDTSAKITIHVLNVNRLKNDKLSSKLSKGPLELFKSTKEYPKLKAVQSFDITENSKYYFSQLYGQTQKEEKDKRYLHIYTLNSNDKAARTKSMTLHAAGHGQSLSIETVDGKNYVWLGNYGSLNKTFGYNNGYKFCQTFSRIPFTNKTLEPSNDIVEHFYYSMSGESYLYNFESSIDAKNNRLTFRAAVAKDGKESVNNSAVKTQNDTMVRTYRLKDAMAITPTTVTLKRAIITKDSNDKITTQKNIKVKVRDLSTIDSLYDFTVKKDHNFPMQGFDINNGIFYGIEDLPDEVKHGSYTYTSSITVILKDLKGQKLGNGTYKLQLDDDNIANILKTKGNYYGYLEPEGIQARNGHVYISATARLKDNDSQQLIFDYDLTK